MDAETLERLLMDRALGGLTPDVEALLDAYLERDSHAAARAAEFQAAAIAARRVLSTGSSAALPPFPAVRLEHIGHVRRRLVLVRNVAGLAAALVLGVGLGAAYFRHVGERAGGAVPLPGAAPAKVVAVASTVTPSRGSADFWSAQRLYEQMRSVKRPETPRVFWSSSVQLPRLGG